MEFAGEQSLSGGRATAAGGWTQWDQQRGKKGERREELCRRSTRRAPDSRKKQKAGKLESKGGPVRTGSIGVKKLLSKGYKKGSKPAKGTLGGAQGKSEPCLKTRFGETGAPRSET